MVAADFWLKFFRRWFEHLPADTSVVVPDVRFQNEADLIRELGGVLVRITRDPPGGRAGQQGVDAHESEFGVAAITGADMTIHNDGTVEDLCQACESCLWLKEK
jgi:hypothetical protein